MFDIGYKKPFVLHQNVKSINNPKPTIFGHAFTCKGQKILHPEDMDDSIRIEMFREFTPGCIQVLESDGEKSVALFGDVSAMIAKKFGAIGAVVDAPTRDADYIDKLNFPLFCRGIQPCSALYVWQITEYQTAITMDGIHGKVKIAPNDYIFGDRDGVLVIPAELVHETLVYAQKRMADEDEVRRQVAEASVEDLLKMKDDVVIW